MWTSTPWSSIHTAFATATATGIAGGSDTPGGQLLATQPGQPFAFEEIDCVEQVRAKIRQFDLSGHADRDELVALARKLSPKTTFLHHGDPHSRAWFANELSGDDMQLIDPEPLITYET